MLYLSYCYIPTVFLNLLLKDRLVSGPKIDQKPKNRVLDAVNDVLFSKTISNKFTTVHNIVFNMVLCYKSIHEFVASKRVLDSVNLVLFSKTVSNKFITVQDVVFIILLYCNSIPEFVA